MCPEAIFVLSDIRINGYLLAYSVGFFVTFGMAIVLAKEKGLPQMLVTDLSFLSAAAAYIGGRLYYAVLFQKLRGWDVFTGKGAASLGAIIGVLSVILLFVHIHPKTRSDPSDYTDISAPCIALYSVFARIGCFSAGCCHGKPAYELPWAVIFTHPSSGCIFKGIPVHPAQLYEIAGDMCIFILLLTVRNRPIFRGNLLWVYGLGYGLIRFVIEFYRGDVRPMIGALSWNQWICLCFMLTGGIMLVRRFMRRGALPLTSSS
jgi:phosphatidylglycerol:prolipoprotein diacylglycerol transferase